MRGHIFTITALLATILLAGCGVPANKFRLNGKFKHIRSADIFIYSDEGYDTLHVRDGKFRYERELREPKVLTIQYPDFSQRKLIAEPGKVVKFTTDAADLSKTSVKGTDENEALSKFYDEVNGKRPDEVKALAADFVNHNPSMLAAQVVMETFLLNAEQPDARLLLRLIPLLRRSQPHNTSLAVLASRVEPMLKAAPGTQAPAFRVKTWKGVEISNATFAGRYLLISFWASWEYDSFQQIRSLKGVVRPFRDKLGLINVCLDYDYRSFRNTMTRDTLPEYNICDRQAWRTELVRRFGACYVPGNVLISPDGKILARDIKAGDIKARLAKLIH